MTVQEISVSNNQRKKLSQAINDDSIAQVDDNGDVIVNVEAYKSFQKDTKTTPIEDVLGEQKLDFSNEFFVFS